MSTSLSIGRDGLQLWLYPQLDLGVSYQLPPKLEALLGAPSTGPGPARLDAPGQTFFRPGASSSASHPLLSRPRLPLLSLYPSDPVSLLVCAGGVGAPGRTVSLFEVRAWVDRVSGRAVCWLGAGTGFQVFNSP